MQTGSDAEGELEKGQGDDERGFDGWVVVRDFSFLWFTLSMNTGILSILLHEFPYQFTGLSALSSTMFLFNILLFSLLFIILMLRCIFFPKAIVASCSSNIIELSMLGAVPIAWYTVVSQIGLTASTAAWGGRALFLVAYVGWWIGTATIFTVAVLVVVVVGKTDIVSSETLSPTIILPFVGTATGAVVGALIVSHSADVDARLAIPVIITSYILAGIGFFAAMMIYAAYFIKLMNTSLPPPEKTPGLVLLAGPSGQSAAAALALGNASQKFFGGYDRGSFLQASAGDTLATIGVLFALMFIGLGLLFAAFAIYIIIETAFKRQHKYSLIWWSTIFPIATIATAWIEFAENMDSPTFRVLAAIFVLLLLVDYFVNWVFTLRDIYRGKLLSGARPESAANVRTKAH